MLTELEKETIYMAADLFNHLSPKDIKKLEKGLAQLFEERKKPVEDTFKNISSPLVRI